MVLKGLLDLLVDVDTNVWDVVLILKEFVVMYDNYDTLYYEQHKSGKFQSNTDA